MARALIVGCGCRGIELAQELATAGLLVRGTSRSDAGLGRIAAAGFEAARADPDRVGTVLDEVDDVAVILWALGSARGEPELVEAVNGPRLERTLERLVDTPVRGFVYDGAGTAPPDSLAAGAALVRAAGERWRMPVEVVEAPGDAWVGEMAAAARGLLGL